MTGAASTVGSTPRTDPPSAPSAPPSADLLGLRLLQVTEAECVDLVVSRSAAGEGGWMVTPNLDILRQCVGDRAIGDLVRRADVLVADGMPLIWAGRLQGTPFPERVCGSNLVTSVSAGAAAAGLSLYLLGGDEGTADRAARLLIENNPGLRVVGTWCPPFGFERDEGEIEAMSGSIAEAAPDIIFVALSFPKGERLIERVRAAAPDAWWIGVGISFSFLCGDVHRAPRWMQRIGLEWFHRLLQEPRRMAKRYLVHDLPFAARLLAGSAVRRFRRDGAG